VYSSCATQMFEPASGGKWYVAEPNQPKLHLQEAWIDCNSQPCYMGQRARPHKRRGKGCEELLLS
jgi:hypothetical protein